MTYQSHTLKAGAQPLDSQGAPAGAPTTPSASHIWTSLGRISEGLEVKGGPVHGEEWTKREWEVHRSPPPPAREDAKGGYLLFSLLTTPVLGFAWKPISVKAAPLGAVAGGS